jgi:hypothetical protein
MKSRKKIMVATLVVALASAAFQSVTIRRATTNPPPQRVALPNINLDSEIRVLDGFVDDWLKVHKQQIALSKKSSITNNEFTVFKSSSEGLQNRCSEFQTAIRNTIKKLKDANRWDGLDDDVTSRLSNERLKTILRDGGGARRLLEDASSQFCSQAQREITDPIETLRPKLSARAQDPPFELRFVLASYQPPTPKFGDAQRCTGSMIRLVARMIVGKSIIEGQASKNFDCFCLNECGSAGAAT